MEEFMVTLVLFILFLLGMVAYTYWSGITDRSVGRGIEKKGSRE